MYPKNAGVYIYRYIYIYIISKKYVRSVAGDVQFFVGSIIQSLLFYCLLEMIIFIMNNIDSAVLG